MPIIFTVLSGICANCSIICQLCLMTSTTLSGTRSVQRRLVSVCLVLLPIFDKASSYINSFTFEAEISNLLDLIGCSLYIRKAILSAVSPVYEINSLSFTFPSICFRSVHEYGERKGG